LSLERNFHPLWMWMRRFHDLLTDNLSSLFKVVGWSLISITSLVHSSHNSISALKTMLDSWKDLFSLSIPLSTYGSKPGIFLFSIMSRLALGPTQPPIQQVLRAVYPG
jgi:hypothetical protein